MTDLDLLFVPLAELSDEPEALRERLLAALRACVARSLPARAVEVDHDPDAQQFSVRELVVVDSANLERARSFGAVELGDELGFDIWEPTEDAAAFLGLAEATWSRFRDRAELSGSAAERASIA